MRVKNIPTKEWLSEKYIVVASGCWVWTEYTNEDGYGRIRDNGKMRYAHVISYNLYVGQVPDNLELDHKCRVRNCVNWEHLEPVTHKENMRRGVYGDSKISCIKGHLFLPENTYYGRNNNRMCKICTINRANERRERIKFFGIKIPKGWEVDTPMKKG